MFSLRQGGWIVIFLIGQAFAATGLEGGIQGKALQTCRAQATHQCKMPFGKSYVDCLKPVLEKIPACAQSLVFLDKTQGDIQSVHRGKRVDVVYANVLAADQASAYFMVSHAGELIELTGEIDPKSSSEYQALLTEYPNATLWPLTDLIKLPPIQKLPHSAERVVFKQTITDGCHACKKLAVAEVAYDFDNKGHFEKASLIGLKSL